MHPHRKDYPEDVYWFLLRGIRERYWDWRHQFIVVTVQEDGEERIAGAADWRRIGDGGKSMDLAWFDARELMPIKIDCSVEADTRKGNMIAPSISLYHKAMLQFFPNRAADPTRASILSNAVANAASYWTGEHAECWDLYVCGVHPDFQGKGIGKMLVNWGVRMADQQSTSASVLCGEKNRVFYNRGGLTEDMGALKGGSGGGGIALFRSARKE